MHFRGQESLVRLKDSLFGKLLCLFGIFSQMPCIAVIENIDDAIQQTRQAVEETAQEINVLKHLNGNLNTHSDVVPALCDCRLTLESNVAVPNTDQIGINTVYFTPYQGSNVTLYNGTIWQTYSFSQISITLAGLTTGDNYDVFVFNNAGTVALALSAKWTSNTARATALTLLNGVYVESTNTTHLYVGTIRTTAATTTEDSVAHRFVWNYFNRRRRVMSVNEAASTWEYTTAAWRSADADATVRLQYVVGINEPLVEAIVLIPTAAFGGDNVQYSVGIGVDSTTANSAQVASAYGSSNDGSGTTAAEYRGYPGLGYHFLQWIEFGSATGQCTFYGTDFGFKGGIFGYLET
jgi:hypothetical protein